MRRSYSKQFWWMLLTISYIIFIWLQSEFFNPQLIEVYADYLNLPILLFLGVIFELLHLVEFGILFMLLVQTFKANPNGQFTKRKMVICLVLSLLYGVIDEIHQFFVPYRSFSVIDILKNFIGVFLAYYIVNKRHKW